MGAGVTSAVPEGVGWTVVGDTATVCEGAAGAFRKAATVAEGAGLLSWAVLPMDCAVQLLTVGTITTGTISPVAIAPDTIKNQRILSSTLFSLWFRAADPWG
jgi:hypothetical protein